jgi:hypothetical protein
MSSLKQIEANRRNALKSTGPTTPEGKERSRCNAVRHGLTAETVIADLEDADDYQAFEAAVTADYDAQTAVERELVLRLASVLWRLRRATGIESGVFERVHNEAVATKNSAKGAESRATAKLFVIGTTTTTDDGSQCDPEIKAIIADHFITLAELPAFPLDRLSRYEHLLWRQASQLVVTLENLKRHHRSPRRLQFHF